MSDRKVLARLLAMVAPFKGWVLLSVLAGFATIASSVGLMATAAYIISAAALHPSVAVLQVAIVGVRFFGISRGAFRYAERLITHEATFHILARLRVWFYRALEPLAPARLLSYRSGDLLARILGDIESLENFFGRVVAPPLTAALVAAAATAFLAFYNLRLGLILLAFLVAAGAGVPLLARRAARRAGAEQVARRARLNAALVDGLQGMGDLLAFGQEERQKLHVRFLDGELAESQRWLAGVNALQTGLMTLLAHLGMAVVLVAAIPLVRLGQIEGVALAALALAALTSFEAVQPLPLAAQQLESHLAAARRLFEIVDATPEVSDPDEPLPLPGCFSLEARGLGFRYPGSGDDFCLSEVDFRLEPGWRVAVVGPSGAGKSTLAHLLLRFYEYREGEIRLNGEDLRRYDPDMLRKRVAVVAQGTYLFAAGLGDNLRIARPQAAREEMDRAMEAARLGDFVRALPEGYDTWIGEGGYQISGGERQRLSVARALLKDAPLLILDEATASLDALTEAALLRSLYRRNPNQALLVITHRLAGLEEMDEILVMQDGRVVERGRHAELLEWGGLYRRMWEIQNSGL